MQRSRPIWWKGDHPVTLEDSPDSYSSHTIDNNKEENEFSFQSSLSPYSMLEKEPSFSQYSRFHEASCEPSGHVFTVPVRGSETPITRSKLPTLHGACRTPEVRNKLQNASARGVQVAAMEMFRVLRRNGLVSEADKALQQMDHSRVEDASTVVGMEFILKDGIVNYLKEIAKLAPPIPKQVMRFSDISLTVTQEQWVGYETFGRNVMGCLLGPLSNVLGKKSIKKKIQVLNNLDGYIMPGTITLLLGPPGSGKSSLLNVLAGRCKSNKATKLQGTVMYNNRLASEILLTRLIAYINGQVNRHLPFLTVRETLEFAGECTQSVKPESFTPEMRKYFAQALVQGQDPYLEYVLHVLGLKPVENHLVGSGQDGLSSADKHRLTSAEIAMGTYAVMLYDQPCYGQDAQATYDLVSTLRAMSRIQHSSVVMSLVQVSPEVFELFDRVILLSQGSILYQGPRQDVLDYFSALGYIKPSHIDTAAFLQDIAADEGDQYISGNYKAYGIDELASFFKASDIYKDILRIVNSEDIPYTYWVENEPNIGLSLRKSSTGVTEVIVSKVSGSAQGMESTRNIQEGDVVTGISDQCGILKYIAIKNETDRKNYLVNLLESARGHIRLQVERRTSQQDEDENEHFRKAYVQSWWQSTKTLIKRQMRFTSRLRILIILRIIQVVILGVFGGTIFYKFGGSVAAVDMNIVRAIGFVSTFSIMLVNVVQLPVYMIQRPVFYKHRAQRFFRASSYLVAHSIVNAPQSFLEALLYGIPVYFLSKLSLEQAGIHVFQFLLLLVMIAYMGSFLVIFLSTITPVLEAGNALAGMVVSLGLLFSGFIIFPSLTPSYWKWMLTVNPLHWGNIIFCMNEFLSHFNHCKDYQNLQFCTIHPEYSVGRAFLEFFQVDTDTRYILISYLAIALAIVVLFILSYIGLRTVVFPDVSPYLSRHEIKQQYHSLDQDSNEENSVTWNELSRITELSNNLTWIKNHNDNQYDQEYGQSDGQLSGQLWKSSNTAVRPLTLSFHQLTLTLSNEKLVLDRVSGYAKPGNMLAIIGNMKSGKSTLLRCIAGRTCDKQMKGDVLVNGFKLNKATFSHISGFVEEVDAHQPFLTVKESLEFSAGLRFGGNTSPGRRAFHVELVLELMNLGNVKHHLVGSLKFANGTYFLAKKLTIAVELAANPSIIFLEDPTAELDSVATRNILFALQTVAASGRTIISTIQQPSTRVLSVFNNVLILKPGGEQVYFGPVGWNCNQLVSYFAAVNEGQQVNKIQYDTQNPVTYVFDSIKNIQQNLSLVYKASPVGISTAEELKRLRKQHRKNVLVLQNPVYAASYRTQARLVLLRTHRFLYRNVRYTFGRLTGSITLGLLFGSVYFQIESEDTFSVSSRSLFIYIQVMLLGVVIANNVVPQLGTDRIIYYREQRSNMYAPIFYPLAWAVLEIPYLFISTLAFVGIANGMAGVATESSTAFVVYWLCLFLFTTTVMYFGMLVTFATPSPILAAFIVSVTNSIWVSASGVIVPKLKMRFYQWLYWANPFQFVTDGLTAVSFYCDTGIPACVNCRVGLDCSGCSCKRLFNLESSVPGSLPLYVWDRISKQRSLSIHKVAADFAALGGMSILFAILGFVLFICLKHNRVPPV